jgi:OHCU decarboxylase
VNADNFIKRYGGIYEHSSWVAKHVHGVLGDTAADTELLAKLMADCVDNASVEKQLELMRAHPDLAGKTALAGELTADSTEEQTKAGLDQCTPAEFEKFQALNSAYKEKFDFPFIMAVRDSSRLEILESFERRLDNDYELEFETALQEIHKIARLRLAALEKGS